MIRAIKRFFLRRKLANEVLESPTHYTWAAITPEGFSDDWFFTAKPSSAPLFQKPT